MNLFILLEEQFCDIFRCISFPELVDISRHVFEINIAESSAIFIAFIEMFSAISFALV